jgi:PrtD family type I secretion system ABC transporter
MAAPRADEADAMREVFGACRGYLFAAAAFSLAVNILYLASPLYMLQVYNRVVNSGSEITLILLTGILLVAYAALAILDLVRSRVLNRMSIRLERLLSETVFAASFRPATAGNRSQPLRDLDSFRQFVSSSSVTALLDLPWVPLYIIAAFLLHPVIGTFTLVGSIVLLVLAISNEFFLSRPLREANEAAARSHSFVEMGARNAEVVTAMGMIDGVVRRWRRDRVKMLERQIAASDRGAAMHGLIRFLRLSMQSLILGLGALLAVSRLVSVGAMFASTFLLGRALQPVEQIVGNWRNIVAARVAYLRLKELLAQQQRAPRPMDLPRPQGALALDNLHFALPGIQKFTLRGITLKLEPGEALGVVGPSGAGKSTLMRLIVGVLKPSAGAVRLDGADIQQWPTALLGRHLGYLPQDIELFADTVAANISRFTAGADAEIVKAAQMAGVHEMILRLPQGYNTQVGVGGAVLSGGYRQRIGLARAVFGIPSLVVLDEPSSNLDADGDAALAACLASLKALGSTVVIVSHRPASLGAVDRILFLKDGAVEAFGPREQIAARLTRRPAATPEMADG